MNLPVRIFIMFLLAPLFFAPQMTHAAISISVTGTWSETVDKYDLISGAGSDLTASYESATDQVSITVSNTSGAGDSWRVDVRKVDTNWHSDLSLWVKRTGSGTGGSVSGGSSYQQLTGSDQSFFTGSDDVSGITVQLKLSGMSVQVPPGSYTTTVYYTVVDI